MGSGGQTGQERERQVMSLIINKQKDDLNWFGWLLVTIGLITSALGSLATLSFVDENCSLISKETEGQCLALILAAMLLGPLNWVVFAPALGYKIALEKRARRRAVAIESIRNTHLHNH